MGNTRKSTLADHIDILSPKEQRLIVWSINNTNHLGYEVHQGMLPFIKVEDVLTALTIYGGSTTDGMRVQATIRSKLRGALGISDAVEFTMYLNPSRVAKRFGAHPERGHVIPQVMKKRVTVGVKWSLPKKDYVPDDDVHVAPHVVLKPTFQRGKWSVICEKRYREVVSNFLMDYCS